MLFLACCFFFSFAANASYEKDSTFVANYFNQKDTIPLTQKVKNEINKFKSEVPKHQEDLYFYRYSKYLLVHGELKESQLLSEKGLKLFENQKDTIRAIKFYNLIAAVYSMQKEYVKAIELFNKSIAISEKNKNFKQAAYLQNNVANIFFSLQDYLSAYTFASKSIANLKGDTEDPFYSQILSVLSVAEAKIGKYASAKLHAESAFKLAQKTNDLAALIIAQYALGDIALSEKRFDVARTYFANSLEISDRAQQYNFSMLNCIGLAVAQNELKEYKEAIANGEKGIAIATALNNSNTIYSLKKNLALSYAGIGQNEKAYSLLLEAHSIYKETTNADRQKDINDILIKYDTEKKEKELAKKNIELLEKNVREGKFYQTISILIFILILLAIFFFVQRMRNKNEKIRLAVENEKHVLSAIIQGEEDERSRIASELHDGLASALTAAKFKMESLEFQNAHEKSELIELLRTTHEDTRRIAHNLSPLLLEKNGLFSSLQQFCRENTTDKTQVDFSGTGDEKNSSKSIGLITYRVTQELVQNAIKHANASLITVNFFSSKEELQIIVEDNGIGFDTKQALHGTGLMSCANRINSLNGTFEIDSTPGEGCVILINLPQNV